MATKKNVENRLTSVENRLTKVEKNLSTVAQQNKQILELLLGKASNAQNPTSTNSKPTSSRGTSNAKSKKFEFAKSKDLAKDWKYLQEHLDGVRVDISDKKTYRLVSKTGDGRGTGRVSFSARALGFEYDPTTFTLAMPMADWNKLCDAVDNLKK